MIYECLGLLSYLCWLMLVSLHSFSQGSGNFALAVTDPGLGSLIGRILLLWCLSNLHLNLCFSGLLMITWFTWVCCPQVDIMQMCVVELTQRPGKPLFHLEHYIEGKYIKYNSNSGFVRDENIRLTPQVCYLLNNPLNNPHVDHHQRSNQLTLIHLNSVQFS